MGGRSHRLRTAAGRWAARAAIGAAIVGAVCAGFFASWADLPIVGVLAAALAAIVVLRPDR